MPRAVLVTQCLQHDFVGLVGEHDPLPNKLHVGPAEARRLLGPDPAHGPVAAAIAWARSRPEVTLVHVRDWHDRTDPTQVGHLAAFGAHCLADTPGARFVFGDALPEEHVVDATGLADLHDTRLPEVLRELAAWSPDGRLRVAVVGVWTEAKVTFLLYDLATRAGVTELATCSALCASASRAQHFNALGQLERILGVTVCDGVGDLARWLTPETGYAPPPRPKGFGPRLDLPLDEADRDVVGDLYREAARLELEPLGGGFSGNAVYRVRAFDALGTEMAPSVAKLGPSAVITKERVAHERVEDVLGNHAPRVRAFVDLGERAGIRYGWAAMGRGGVRTLKKLVEGGAPVAQLEQVLHTVFDDVLGRFLAVATYDRLPLLEHYGFEARWAPGVRRRIEAVAGHCGPVLTFPGGRRVPNLISFYEDFLAGSPSWPEHHYTAVGHGDLNGANVLVDGQDNVWVIDWFHAGRQHVLRDLAKVENDLLYLFTDLGEAELPEALALTDALLDVRDLRAPLPDLDLSSPPLRRAWALLRVLREVGGRLVREDRDPTQLTVALLRYSVHTLGFDEASPTQKSWALYAASRQAQQVMARVAAFGRLRIDDIPGHGRPGRLGLTICPGRRDRGRHLDDDLDALREAGTDTLVCLLPHEEIRWLGVDGLRDGVERRGMAFVHLPIPDQGVPTDADGHALVDAVLARLDRGERIVAHCMGGIGRSGVLAACVLTAGGRSAEAAIGAVRGARDPRAVENEEQEAFVARFASR